jgi:ComF family protein
VRGRIVSVVQSSTMLLRRLLGDVIDVCLPGRCAVCRTECGSESICQECADQLREMENAPMCSACAKPVAFAGADCPFCNDRGMRNYDRVVALSRFADPMAGLIKRIKYQGYWPLAEVLAERCWQSPRVRTVLADADGLLPVPLHRWRQFRRGFNQAAILAKRLSRLSGIPLIDAVRRRRNTPTQTHLHSRAKRFANLQDAFELLDPRPLHDRNIVVIDDVTTTGATLQTLARALKPARPKKLSAIVIAVSDPKGRDFTRK